MRALFFNVATGSEIHIQHWSSQARPIRSINVQHGLRGTIADILFWRGHAVTIDQPHHSIPIYFKPTTHHYLKSLNKLL
jgi:hypothetical protein